MSMNSGDEQKLRQIAATANELAGQAQQEANRLNLYVQNGREFDEFDPRVTEDHERAIANGLSSILTSVRSLRDSTPASAGTQSHASAIDEIERIVSQRQSGQSHIEQASQAWSDGQRPSFGRTARELVLEEQHAAEDLLRVASIADGLCQDHSAQ